MSESSANPDGKVEATDVRCTGRCGIVAIGVAILSMVRAAQALAGEQPTFASGPVKPDFSPTRPTMPLTSASTSSSIPEDFRPSAESFRSIVAPEEKVFSATEFRPRGRSIDDKDSLGSADAPMMKGTSAWQRLDDYRSHNRVRLLTLWEDGASTLSLQAGKRGSPSLQWTSRSMNRGGATRGLFDELFSVSLSSAGRGFKPTPRGQTTDTATKPIKPETADVK